MKTLLNFFCLHFCRAHSKLEDACDLYQRAGNAYKMAKKWSGMFSVKCEFFLHYNIVFGKLTNCCKQCTSLFNK